MKLKKIFPAAIAASPAVTFKLVIVAEGFTTSQEQVFYNNCNELVSSIFATTPFSLTRHIPSWINIYTYFQASANEGCAVDAPASAGRTAFESSLASAAELLSFNTASINDFIDNVFIQQGDSSEHLSTRMSRGTVMYGSLACLVLVLLPPTGGNGGEYEHSPAEEDYYFVATTQDGEWHQVVIRAIAKCLGLWDEFELSGTDYGSPGEDDAHFYHSAARNLVYFDTPPGSAPDSSFKWRKLLSATQQLLPLEVVSHPGDANTPDRSLSTEPISSQQIKLYEGGGGYRSRIYRSSFDCLLRRRIGDTSIPVRKQLVPLCPVCLEELLGCIK
jgi:hypothetical protein